MRNPTTYKQFLLRLFTIIISIQFSLIPNHSYAQTNTGNGQPIPINIQSIRNTLDLSPAQNQEIEEKLTEINKLIDGVMKSDPSQFYDKDNNQPAKFFNNQHIPSQSLLEAGETQAISLLQDQGKLPLITFDQIVPEIVESRVHLNGYNNGKFVASHVIPSIDAASLIHDPELIIIIEKSGGVLAIDKAMMIQNIFKAPFTVHSIVGKINNWNPEKMEQTKASFLTRGTQPFLIEELASNNTNESIYLTHNLRNEVLLNAGDLILSEEGTSKKILGVYSRAAIYERIELNTKEQVALQTLYSFEADGQTFAEKREELLQIGDHITNPTKELLELYTDEEKKAFDQRKDQFIAEGRMNPEIAAFLANSTRSQIKDGIKAAKSLKSKATRKVDTFTYSEWQESYQTIKNQALLEVSKIQERLESLRKHQSHIIKGKISSVNKSINHMEEGKKALQAQLESGNFSNVTKADGVTSIDYQELLKASIKGNFSFSQKMNPWYKKLTLKKMKNLGKKFLRISFFIAAGTGTGLLGTQLITGLSVGDQFKLLTDIYKHSIFPVLLDGVPYWQTAALGITSLLAIVPLAYLFGTMFAPMLDKAKLLTKPGSTSRTKLENMANTFRPVSGWQANVTLSMRGYARLLLPYYHKLLKVFKQPTISVMKLGLNPFKRVEYAGKKRFLGFNPPAFFKDGKIDKERMKDLGIERNKLIIDISKNKKKQEILAWTLATIVVSKQESIDPATLMGVADSSLNIKTLEDIHSNPQAKEKWQLTAREFLSYIKQNSDGVDLSSISDEKIADYYNEVKRIAQKINDNSKARNNLLKLKHSFNKMGSSTSKAIAMYGVEDYEFLTNIVASPFVAEQTAREFILDHAIVATVPSFVGERANPETLNLENGRDIIAHNPEGFMGNSLQHNYDVFNNTLAHLLMAGPGTALVYQKVKAENTALYNPVESYLLSPTARPEGFLRAAVTWAKGVIDFKSSNLGGYYLKSFLRRFTTLQASLTFTLVARVIIADQSLQAAFMAYALFWFAGVLTYGWPWTIISRGNQYLGENVANKTSKLKQARTKLFDGLRMNDESLINEGYEALQDVYFENYSESQKPLITELQNVAKNLKQDLPMKAIKKLLSSGKEKEAYTIIAKVINDYQEKRFTNPSAAVDGVRDIRLGRANLDGLSKSEKAKLLLEESLTRSPQYNAVNKTIPWMTTFWFGAVFTTILAVSLTVMSFDPSKLTVGYIAGWAGKLALFYPLVFALTSSYTWNKLGESKIYKRLKRFTSSLCNNHYKVKP